MAKNDLFDFDDATAANNTDVQGANIAEGCAPSGINNAIRGALAIVCRALGTQGANIASAGTTSIGAAGTALYTHITGTTTITAFGTVKAGTFRILEFDGILTLTHNATSLKLPGAANITTAAGDIGFFISLGSGNWKCLSYQPAAQAPLVAPLTLTSTAAGTLLTLSSTDAGAGQGPNLDLFRNSASPAANDITGAMRFLGKDSGGNTTTYAEIVSQIADPTDASEDTALYFTTLAAGAGYTWTITSGGLFDNTGGLVPKGSGTVNASGLYIKGHGTVAQMVEGTSVTYQTCSTSLPVDNTIPQITEGDQVLTATIVPTNASSTLDIEATLNIGASTTMNVGIGLFVDATANALAATSLRVEGATPMYSVKLRFSVSAASTASRVYRVRVGPNAAGNAFLNGDGGARQFGGVAVSSLRVTEILPQ